MESLGLLVGHLLGDYWLQGDWLAANKANPHPGAPPCWRSGLADEVARTYYPAERRAWEEKAVAYRVGHGTCALHCTLYTLAVWLCAYWWITAWGLVACWLAHFPIDRWGLARRLMRWKHEGFATRMGPWSVILCDNILHLLVLFAIGRMTL